MAQLKNEELLTWELGALLDICQTDQFQEFYDSPKPLV